MANLIFDKAQIETAIDKIVDRTMRMELIQGDQAVPHRAGVDRPARQSQFDILVHAVLDQLQVAA